MLETPSIRRYSSTSHPFDGVVTREVQLRPVRTISRKGPVHLTGWIGSQCDLGNWVAGFVDGEGSFNVPVRRERDRGLPWRVSLSFNVSQIGEAAPELLRTGFGTGMIEAAMTV